MLNSLMQYDDREVTRHELDLADRYTPSPMQSTSATTRYPTTSACGRWRSALRPSCRILDTDHAEGDRRAEDARNARGPKQLRIYGVRTGDVRMALPSPAMTTAAVTVSPPSR